MLPGLEARFETLRKRVSTSPLLFFFVFFPLSDSLLESLLLELSLLLPLSEELEEELECGRERIGLRSVLDAPRPSLHVHVGVCWMLLDLHCMYM